MNKLILSLSAALLAASAQANLVVVPVDEYFVVHQGAGAAAILEVRFVANPGIDRAEAWWSVRRAVPNQPLANAFKGIACSTSPDVAKSFELEVRGQLAAAKAPVELVGVILHCQPHTATAKAP